LSALPLILRGRRRAAPLALGLAFLAVAGIAAVTLLGGDGNSGARKRSASGSSATVTRRTLVERQTVDGTLGYAGHRTVINRLAASSASNSPTGDSSDGNRPASSNDSPAATIPAALFTPDQDGDDSTTPQYDQPKDKKPKDKKPKDKKPQSDAPANPEPHSSQSDSSSPSSSSPTDSSDGDSSDDGSSNDSYKGTGTLTAMARAGSVVHAGGVLYRLDGDPIVLMYGSTPVYRALKSGVADGADVRELERNLAALGFDPGTVDEAFTSTTAAAVSDWQESVGLEQTGTVELGRVVFMPGARRIGAHKASVGTVLSSGAEVLDTSSTKRVVSVPLDATKQSLAHEGARVTVTLPDGGIVRGRISSIGRVAREDSSGSSDPNAEKLLVIDVTVELRSKRGIGRLDEAPVGVGLAEQSRRHVLSVPVNALLARRGGGYGVELAASHRIVGVEAGLFAGGYVEVSGSGIREGTRVVVPSE
jgi:peptidoglycan hydrolase-like protein with peptidoglycan-binding domain